MARTMLVAIKPGAGNQVVTKFAQQLAQRHSLSLAGVAVLDPAELHSGESVPLGGDAFRIHRDRALLEQSRRMASLDMDEFVSSCGDLGITCEGTIIGGDLPTRIRELAPRHDLVALGHTADSEPAGTQGRHSALAQIIKACPRPTIVVPQPARPASAVLVAYDGSPQAARAVAAFVNLGLYADSTIHTLAVCSDRTVGVATSEIVKSYLMSHGRRVEPHIHVNDGPPAEAILSAAKQLAVELLVMGAYGKPVWRDLLLGSVTQQTLRKVNIPVLMDH